MLFLFLLLLSAPKSYPKFDISVPRVPQLGIHGQTVDLPCSFPVGSSWDLDTTVITWHRHLEIIHSFYHGQDQLDLQSAHYANRTSLYHADMQRGSASLRLDRVTVRDEGEYTCSVSTEMGSQKRSLKLTVAELTQEPVFHITSLSNIKVARLISLEEYSSPSLVDDATDITQVGIIGQSVVLPCSFPVGSSFHLDTTEIIWEHNQEWIHIFYHSRDQLQHQSPHYTNRTSLYREEIKNGNASLRLENATLRDEGEYTCTVIPWDEGQIKTLNLKIAVRDISRKDPEAVNTAVRMAIPVAVLVLGILLAVLIFLKCRQWTYSSSGNPKSEEHQNSPSAWTEENETYKEPANGAVTETGRT